MEFRLLGPVAVRVGGQRLDLGTPRQRAVLAALLVEAGRPVGLDALVERIWADDAPADPRPVLYAYLSRLRRTLPPCCPGPVRVAGGYELAVDPDLVDLHRFRRLVVSARDTALDADRRAGALAAALELWAGVPLADLRGTWPERMRAAWRHEHLDAVVAWAEVEIGRGRPEAVIEPARRVAADNPVAESVSRVLMRALAGAGREAEALDQYAALRARLAEELGCEPGTLTQQVHQALLAGAPPPAALPHPPHPPHPPQPTGPDPARADPARPDPRWPTPAQLPPDVRAFTGRAAELSTMDAALTAPAIVVVSGTAGVGKTALAVRWAHRRAGQFPDGQLYANLRGYDPLGQPAAPAEALHGFLEALGVPPDRIPQRLPDQAGLYRSLLAGKRLLVVLDNARDAEQVRPLLPGADGCAAVVTSRSQLSGLVAAPGAHPLPLDLLTPAEATDLLAHRLGPDRVAADTAAAGDIIARCARLPLALVIFAAHAAAHPTFALRALADRLRDTHAALDPFTGRDQVADVRAVFSASYRTLAEPAARLFRLLGLHPGPDLGVAAAGSLLGVPPHQARPLLADLVEAHLVTEHAPDRFAVHDLLRAYAAELLDAHEPAASRRQATSRMLDHYLHTAHAADTLLDPHRDPIALGPPAPGACPDPPADRDRATAWFTAELPVLLAAVRLSADTAAHTPSWQLAWCLVSALDLRGRWQDWTTVQHTALAAARGSGDRTGQAIAHRLLGRAHLRLGQHDQALDHLQQASDLYRTLADHTGHAHTLLTLAEVHRRQHRYRDALEHAERALRLYRTIGHRIGQANALNGTGWYHTLLGEHDAAVTHCRQALAMLQDLGDQRGEANTWDSLGHAYHHLGDPARATECYHRALRLYRELHYAYREAETLVHLGDTHRATGDAGAAGTAWRQALRILADLGHGDAAEVRTRLADLGRPG